jgi:peptidoglycan hydrolase-like protein with peptidoglycan-binding domain
MDGQTPSATESIYASVGAGGTNSAGDVRTVQDLLNRGPGAGLAVDGVCGPVTRRAIVSFQSGFLTRPDGRVDPDGETLRRLVAARRQSRQTSDTATAAGPADGTRLRQLAQAGHGGSYSYSKAERQYGTDEMLRVLAGTAAELKRIGREMGVGDISFAQGGEMPPHKSHRSGKDVDLRPIRAAGGRGPTSVGEATYDREGTRALVEALRSHSSVRLILFNDTEISGVKFYPKHDNHLHVSMR